MAQPMQNNKIHKRTASMDSQGSRTSRRASQVGGPVPSLPSTPALASAGTSSSAATGATGAPDLAKENLALKAKIKALEAEINMLKHIRPSLQYPIKIKMYKTGNYKILDVDTQAKRVSCDRDTKFPYSAFTDPSAYSTLKALPADRSKIDDFCWLWPQVNVSGDRISLVFAD